MTIDQKESTSDHDAGTRPSVHRLRDIEKTVSSSDVDIRGRQVKDKDGEDLGRIEGLMVDDAEGKVRFMEVAAGGFLGIGEHKSIIPIEAITAITDTEVSISHSRAHVAGAPRYDPDLVVVDSGYFFNLYPYYGAGGNMGASPWVTSWPARNEDVPGG